VRSDPAGRERDLHGRKLSDALACWLTGDGDKTLGRLVEMFEEKSFAILFVLLLGVPALPLPTGGATHVFEIVAVVLALLWIGAHAIVRQLGQDGVCRHDSPRSFGALNGDTPLPGGGLLVSEIPGHWVDDIAPDGRLRAAIRALVCYPSDPQPCRANGSCWPTSAIRGRW
jgi:hypothetical protein